MNVITKQIWTFSQVDQYGRITKRVQKENHITFTGLSEYARRNTGETTTTNSHVAIGTGTTAENELDTSLEVEVGRKAIGQRAAVGGTERYQTTFVAADVSTPPQQITEAGIFTASTAGLMMARIVTDTPLELSNTESIIVSIHTTHKRG